MVCYETVCDVAHLVWLFRVSLTISYVLKYILIFEKIVCILCFAFYWYHSPSSIGLRQATMFRLIPSNRLPTLARQLRLTPDYIG